MKESVEQVKSAYPELPVCYSFTGGQPSLYAEKDLSFFDLLEHHTWIAQLNNGEFDKAVGYNYEGLSPDGYKRLVQNSERVYRERRDYWLQQLKDEIHIVATAARKANLPLITTGCSGNTRFKTAVRKWQGFDETINATNSTGDCLARVYYALKQPDL